MFVNIVKGLWVYIKGIFTLPAMIFKRKKEIPIPISAPIPVLVPEPKDWEKYYHEKYPSVDILYNGRPVPNIGTRVDIDVRNFFTVYDSVIKNVVKSLGLENLTDDEKAVKCLCWVLDNIKYVAEKNADGSMTDYWQFAYETILLRTGDCECQAILLANMLVIADVPYWKVRINAADVDSGTVRGGHAFVSYFYETNPKWVLLDCTFYPNRLPISQRKEYKDETFYKSTWFSFNQKYSYSKAITETISISGLILIPQPRIIV